MSSLESVVGQDVLAKAMAIARQATSEYVRKERRLKNAELAYKLALNERDAASKEWVWAKDERDKQLLALSEALSLDVGAES